MKQIDPDHLAHLLARLAEALRQLPPSPAAAGVQAVLGAVRLPGAPRHGAADARAGELDRNKDEPEIGGSGAPGQPAGPLCPLSDTSVYNGVVGRGNIPNVAK